jgi:hypothetical protein
VNNSQDPFSFCPIVNIWLGVKVCESSLDPLLILHDYCYIKQVIFGNAEVECDFQNDDQCDEFFLWSKNTVSWDAFTVVSIMDAFWDLVPCSSSQNRHFREQLWYPVILRNAEGGGNMFSKTLVLTRAMLCKVPEGIYKCAEFFSISQTYQGKSLFIWKTGK